MNVKLITKALHTLSLLSDEDYDLVLKFRALTEDERGMLMLVLEPSKPAGKKAGKKSSKSSQPETERVFKRCETCGLTKRADVHKDSELGGYHGFKEKKSERAAGIEQQLNRRREQGRVVVSNTCVAELPSGAGICHGREDDSLHTDSSYGDYHPFELPVVDAPTRSPANGGAGNSTANSETNAVSAGAATGGSSE